MISAAKQYHLQFINCQRHCLYGLGTTTDVSFEKALSTPFVLTAVTV